MTVQKDVTKNIYVGNGSTRAFPFTFECPAEHPEYIKVYLMQDDGTALATSDYQLDMDARQITYPSSGTALPEGKKLVIMRELPLQQMMNLVNNGPYFAEDIETAFDENVMAMQQIAEKLNRSIIMNVDIDGDAFVNEVPFEAGKSFRIADDGKSIVLTEDPARVLPLAQEAYAQAQAQAQSAAASARLAEDYKNAAETAKNAASLYATNAKNSAGEAKTYMDNAKRYSENVNVFTPRVSSDGVLSWTNKAGLPNPASVNIKGAKGDQGLQGATGTAATITIGSVTTGAAGSNASVTNSGTASNVVLNFTLPRGNDGADGGIIVDTAMSATSTNPVQNKVIKAELDKKMAKTDKIYEANLEWGGRNIVDGYSPIDAAMIDTLGANRFAFGNIDGVTVEYSEDAGSTWNTYSLTTYDKSALFSIENIYIYAGGKKDRTPTANDMLRVTIDTDAFGVYTTLNKFALLISSGGAQGCFCTIDASLESSPTKFKVFADKVPISGWTGYNIINTAKLTTYANSSTAQYGLIRFTFGSTSAPTIEGRLGLAVLKILAFGGFGWTTPSNMAKTGHLYSYNPYQDATFPATVTAPNFIGKVNGFTIKSSVPTNAKFIDNETSNTWTGQQTFNKAILKDTMLVKALIRQEVYQSEYINGTTITPTRSTMRLVATGATTLDMATIVAECLGNNKTSTVTVFTAYITSDADYTLTITNAGTIKYIGSASDVAITSAGLLLNILMMRDANDNVTSIVQASKLS